MEWRRQGTICQAAISAQILRNVAKRSEDGDWTWLKKDLTLVSDPVMSVTHSIATKRARSRAMASALRDNLHGLANALAPLLFPGGIPDEVDLPRLLNAFADLLEREVSVEEGDTERTLPAELPGDSVDRDEPEGVGAAGSEEAMQSLRHALLRVRGLIASVCGPREPARYSLDGRIPEEPERLLAYARRTVRCLESADPEACRPAPFVTIDLAGAAAHLREHIDALDTLLDADAAQARQRTQAQTSAGVAPHHQAVASIAEALLRLARMDERSESVPPRQQSRATMGSTRASTAVGAGH